MLRRTPHPPPERQVHRLTLVVAALAALGLAAAWVSSDYAYQLARVQIAAQS